MTQFALKMTLLGSVLFGTLATSERALAFGWPAGRGDRLTIGTCDLVVGGARIRTRSHINRRTIYGSPRRGGFEASRVINIYLAPIGMSESDLSPDDVGNYNSPFKLIMDKGSYNTSGQGASPVYEAYTHRGASQTSFLTHLIATCGVTVDTPDTLVYSLQPSLDYFESTAIHISFRASDTTGTYDYSISITANDAAGNPVISSSKTPLDDERPSVAISGAPSSISGVAPFELTYTFSEDVTDFDDVADIIVAGGISSAPTGSGKIYTSTVTPSGAGYVTAQVPEGAAIDTAGNPNEASAAEVIANTIVEDTQKVIAFFMLNRASQILSNQPDLIGFLEGTNSDGGGPLGYLAINGNDDSIELAFSSSLSKVDRARAESLQQLAPRRGSDAHNALTFAAETPNVAHSGDLAGNGYMPTRKYDIWTQIYGSTTSAGDSDNSFWIGFLGAHYFITPDMIIGGLVLVDWADEEGGATGSSADGQGWMIGPYIAGRITGTGLNYEARASWGRSSNNVSPLGTHTDEFETERWLATFKLKGDYMLDMITFRPSVSVSYFEEEQESYTDSLSNTIPSQTISLGEVRFGPEFIRDIALSDGSLFRPSIGISGVWNFGVEEGASPQGYALGNNDLRARLDAGFSLTNPNGMMMSAGAYYDGLAIDEYESMGGNVNVSIPIR